MINLISKSVSLNGDDLSLFPLLLQIKLTSVKFSELSASDPITMKQVVLH